MASKANNTNAGSASAVKSAQQNSAQNKAPTIDELKEMERKLRGDLVQIENDIYITETKYIKHTVHSGGNVFKGWEGGGQGAHRTQQVAAVAGNPRGRQNRNANHEKFFSLSSLSAPESDDKQKDFQAFLEGQPGPLDNMGYYGQYLLPHGDHHHQVSTSGVSTRNNSNASSSLVSTSGGHGSGSGLLVTGMHTLSIRNNSKNQKSAPKGSQPSSHSNSSAGNNNHHGNHNQSAKNVKDSSHRHTSASQAANLVSPEPASKEGRRSGRTGRSSVRVVPSGGAQESSSATRKERPSNRQDSQASQEPPTVFMIEKQSSVASQLNLSQQALSQPIVTVSGPSDSANASGAPPREFSSTQIVVPSSSSHHLTIKPAGAAAAAAENSVHDEHSYASGTGRGKGKDFSDSEHDASRQNLNENTNPNNTVMQQSQSSRAAATSVIAAPPILLAANQSVSGTEDVPMQSSAEEASKTHKTTTTAQGGATTNSAISIQAAAQQVVISAPAPANPETSGAQAENGGDVTMKDETGK